MSHETAVSGVTGPQMVVGMGARSARCAAGPSTPAHPVMPGVVRLHECPVARERPARALCAPHRPGGRLNAHSYTVRMGGAGRWVGQRSEHSRASRRPSAPVLGGCLGPSADQAEPGAGNGLSCDSGNSPHALAEDGLTTGMPRFLYGKESAGKGVANH